MNVLRAARSIVVASVVLGWGMAAEPCAEYSNDIAILLDEGLQRDLVSIAETVLQEPIEIPVEGCRSLIQHIGDRFGDVQPPSLVPDWLDDELLERGVEGGHARWYLVQVTPGTFATAASVLADREGTYGDAIFAAEQLDLFVVYATRFEQFAALFDDDFIEFLVHVMENYPMRPADWGGAMTAIGVPSPAFGGTDGAGVAVAVIDTGVDPEYFGGTMGTVNDDFRRGRVVHEACFSSDGAVLAEGMATRSVCNDGEAILFDYVEVYGADRVPPYYSLVGNRGMRTGVPCEMVNDCRHGSQVAFIAAGKSGDVQGVAPGASIVAIQVASKASADYCTWVVRPDQPCVVIFPLDVIRALHYIVTALESDPMAFGGVPLAAVNLSLHVNRYCDKPDDKREKGPCESDDGIGKWMSARYDTACDDNLFTELTVRLGEQRVWTVIAAGNRNQAEEIGFVSLPGCVGAGITVSGVSLAELDGGSRPEYTLAETSMYSDDLVDIAAPGVELTTPVPVYSSTGTSFAAPQVTGLLALIRSAFTDCPGGDPGGTEYPLDWELKWLTTPENGIGVTIPYTYYPPERGIMEDRSVPGLGLWLEPSPLVCPG